MFAIGLFAAGLDQFDHRTAGDGVRGLWLSGMVGRPVGPPLPPLRLSVVAIGGATAFVFGTSPAATIVFAQLANGLLLPIVAVFLLVVVTRSGNTETERLGGLRLQLARVVVAVVVWAWRILTLWV